MLPSQWLEMAAAAEVLMNDAREARRLARVVWHSKRSVLTERGLDGGENLPRLRQTQFGNGLPQLNFQRRWSAAALACDFGLGLPLGLLHRESDELPAVRFRREAPGRLACFSRLLCSHV